VWLHGAAPFLSISSLTTSWNLVRSGNWFTMVWQLVLGVPRYLPKSKIELPIYGSFLRDLNHCLLMSANPIYLPEIYSVGVWILLYDNNYLIDLTHMTNVLATSNPGVLGLNPNRGMDVCLRLFCVCVLCRERPCDVLIIRPSGPTGSLEIKKLKWNEAFHENPRPQREQQGYEWMNEWMNEWRMTHMTCVISPSIWFQW
jgi:hypothetical protein